VNPILKAVINIIKTIISKIVYNKKISSLETKQKELESAISSSKEKTKKLKEKLKEVPKEKDAKDASDFVKNFINKGRK
tara:strand:- start:1474 stop:1710 length:237 start_codon:yes stop_codon:yes gene_type:complete